MCGCIWNVRDLLQQWGKRKGDQPAHVERHGCSLMWLQLGSPGPNEVPWSSAAPSPIVYPAAAHILPPMHHSGSLRRCSKITPGTLKEKHQKKRKTQAWRLAHRSLGVKYVSVCQQTHPNISTHTHTFTHRLIFDQQSAAALVFEYREVQLWNGSPPHCLL